MKPMFTVHIGEYLVGEHIERTYPQWNVWIPSRDKGVDLLVTDSKHRKAVSLQVKFSKDFTPGRGSPILQSRLLATGWWTLDLKKIEGSTADYWVFVLPSIVEPRPSMTILPPGELLRRLKAIHGGRKARVHSYLWVTKTGRCWETRGLANADQEMLAFDRYSSPDRNFSKFLNAWKQVETRLK